MPNMHSVDSSNIQEIGYDVSTQTLYVRFKRGVLYTYDDVPESVYNELDGAPSIGKYFNANIRDIYNCHKI